MLVEIYRTRVLGARRRMSLRPSEEVHGNFRVLRINPKCFSRMRWGDKECSAMTETTSLCMRLMIRPTIDNWQMSILATHKGHYERRNTLTRPIHYREFTKKASDLEDMICDPALYIVRCWCIWVASLSSIFYHCGSAVVSLSITTKIVIPSSGYPSIQSDIDQNSILSWATDVQSRRNLPKK